MLGFSAITGTDASTGAITGINGLTGTESNSFNGQSYKVTLGADAVMPFDPGHEFPDVLHQLCGQSAAYPPGGDYPSIDNSGYVAAYVASGGGGNPGEVMKCFAPEQLPVLYALAREFAVCDNWHASIPGPTWPNRMFVHAASSSGLDHSPSSEEIAAWETIDGFQFQKGTIFDALAAKGVKRRLYAGDDFPMVAALKGIRLDDIRHYSLFAGDLSHAEYPYNYVFIEPSYDVLNEYRNGNSQHPLGDVHRGEALLKATYESIRNSAHWGTSLLIITWDEHGGFYDHAVPPIAVAPGDTAPGSEHNKFGFTFRQYGPRVPAVIVSPLIPKNLIDHHPYDHASIPATVQALFGLSALTARDKAANHLDSLISLSTPRTDAPAALPAPAGSSAGDAASPAESVAVPASRPEDSVNGGNLPGFVFSALRQDLQSSPPERHKAIAERVGSIQTRAEARQYLHEVQEKIRISGRRPRAMAGR